MDELAAIRKDVLAHTTMQLTLMDEDSEANLYLNKDDHGRTILDLPIAGDGVELIDLMLEACERYGDFEQLSALRTDFLPIVLMACRHWRRPVPPQVYIKALKPPQPAIQEPQGDGPEHEPLAAAADD